jgi:S1-C subfamily serine protease
VKIGDSIVGVGNAGGKGGKPTVAPGKVVDLDQSITATADNGSDPEQLSGLIEVDAALQPGESGGPLFNDQGEVVGIDTAGTPARRNSVSKDGFAIPINTAVAVADDIRSPHPSPAITLGTPSFLGVGADDAPNGGGALINGVVAGSPADTIGLVIGDTITAIDDTPIANRAALGPALHVHKAGEQARISWTDAAGAKHTARATLMTGPAN